MALPNLAQNRRCGLCPDERLGALIVLGNKGGYSALKFAYAAEGSATDPLGRNLRKEPLNGIEP